MISVFIATEFHHFYLSVQESPVTLLKAGRAFTRDQKVTLVHVSETSLISVIHSVFTSWFGDFFLVAFMLASVQTVSTSFESSSPRENVIKGHQILRF